MKRLLIAGVGAPAGRRADRRIRDGPEHGLRAQGLHQAEGRAEEHPAGLRRCRHRAQADALEPLEHGEGQGEGQGDHPDLRPELRRGPREELQGQRDPAEHQERNGGGRRADVSARPPALPGQEAAEHEHPAELPARLQLLDRGGGDCALAGLSRSTSPVPASRRRRASPVFGAPKARISTPSGPASNLRVTSGAIRTASSGPTSTISSSSFNRPPPERTTPAPPAGRGYARTAAGTRARAAGN